MPIGELISEWVR